ncbi:hypothetical protein PVK06_011351 [Gossypium arboreum]|uniref:DUF4283 domain-containing protein n=1 Tax=Gossypium arboreum TaxID=29729 RepID=A0ABR0Q9I4_GOSAR|nr:hypothetical protein PVK06_011351 [Gossypium arboreum]
MNDVESLSDVRTSVGDDSLTDCTTKKVCFKDGSDDSVTNMLVDSSPANGVSWKDKLLHEATSNTFDGDANLDLEFVDGDIRRSNLNGIPAIDFSERINKILIKGMELTVVVKLLGRNIGYGALLNRITSLWKPAQPFRLMDVANGYYLVRFQCRVDYDAVLTQGPWIVFGHYLTVQPWTVDFDLSRPFPYSVLAWIRFPGLSGFLYQKKILEEIGSLIGRVVKFDIKTNNRERGQFARMAVFVDLRKPLTSQVLVNGRLQRVEFEALLEVCFSCGKYRHPINLCPSSLAGTNSHDGEGNHKDPLNNESALTKTGDALPTVGDPFGPWMVVEHKSRRKQDKIWEPSKELGTVRFSKEDFLKKLKGKETELGSGQVAEDNLSESLWGHVGNFEPRLTSMLIKDSSTGQKLGVGACASPRAVDQAFGSVRPSSALGHTHKDSSRAPSSLEPNPGSGHSHRESGLSLECFEK